MERKHLPGPDAVMCCLVSLQARRLFFPSCQQKSLNVKPSSRIALVEESLCPMSLSLLKGSWQTMTGQCRAINPSSYPTRSKSSLKAPYRVSQACIAILLILLSFLLFHCIDRESTPQETSCRLISVSDTALWEPIWHRLPCWPEAFAFILVLLLLRNLSFQATENARSKAGVSHTFNYFENLESKVWHYIVIFPCIFYCLLYDLFCC